MKISYSDEAFEAFERVIDMYAGYVARLTTTDGKAADVTLLGWKSTDVSDVIVVRDYNELDTYQTSPQRTVSLMDVEEVHLY
jgi:hypothetical protein